MPLTSPGVEVQVIDESFYTAAEPGSVPLVVVATAKNKLNGSGTAIAAGTLTSNASNVYRITSQRELVETFGVPFFEKTETNNPIHGSERNEYGLLAAYSLLGVTNSVFVMRADVDLNELSPDATTPGSEPANQTWWVNTAASMWGIQEWNSNSILNNGQRFITKTPTVLTDADTNRIENGAPRLSVGVIGDYAVVFKTVLGSGFFSADDEFAKVYFKSAGNGATVGAGDWVLVGSREWTASWPTASGNSSFVIGAGDDGVISINNIEIELADGDTASVIASKINLADIKGVVAQAVRERLYLFSTGDAIPFGDSTKSGSISIVNGTASATSIGIAAGVYRSPALVHAPHTRRPLFRLSEQPGTVNGHPTGSVWIKTTEPNGGARLRISRWNSSAKVWTPAEAPLYANGATAIYNLNRSGGGLAIPRDTLYTQYNARELVGTPDVDDLSTGITAEFRIWRRRAMGPTSVVSTPINTGMLAGTQSFSIRQSMAGSAAFSAATQIEFTGLSTGELTANAFASAINSASFTTAGVNPVQIDNQIEAEVDVNNRLTITHKTGGEIRIAKIGDSTPFSIFTPYMLSTGAGTVNFYSLSSGNVTGSSDDYLISNWIPLAASTNPRYYAAPISPLSEPDNGQLWFNPTLSEIDIMVHDGNDWRGYLNVYPTTDASGPQVSATSPRTQRSGDPLVENDLWISTANLEQFPTVYRWSGASRWDLLDTTDQTSEDGIVFTDARQNVDGLTNTPSSIVDLLTSDFLDPDAPDPALYPRGILLWNSRRSYGNVKRYVNNYIDVTSDNPRADNESMANYSPDRWVSASPNNEDGSGNFGRNAQRSVVVASIKSAIDTSEEARDEERRNFNLIACPGYPEALSNLINLNIDRKVTAFVVGDTPLRLRSDATTLSNWGSNANLATDNGDAGLVSNDEYCAVYYPNGFTTDLSGANAVVPASHMMLRTIILSDQQSYPWFAPAGTRRGGITNATSVGFIESASGEFRTVALNNGQRDTLYELNINPIPFFVGVGHVAYGQKTRARNASSLDRINVARLVVYLRGQLTRLARPYLFEPNDRQTRDEIKASVESLLIELVGLRAIFDFAVVCDESNNTPARIDRNELYVDIAIEPTKAIEFIFIPLRLQNTGEI